jgi:hypothetical protein
MGILNLFAKRQQQEQRLATSETEGTKREFLRIFGIRSVIKKKEIELGTGGSHR